MDDENIVKIVRRLLIIYNNKIRKILRKTFFNWKLKTFAENPYEKNSIKNKTSLVNDGDDFIDYQSYGSIKKEDEKNNEPDNFDYLKPNLNKDKNSIFKNYNQPFTPVTQNFLNMKNNFIREELNNEFEDKNLTVRGNMNKKNSFNNSNYDNNTYNSDDLNKNIIHSERKINSNLNYSNKFETAYSHNKDNISNLIFILYNIVIVN